MSYNRKIFFREFKEKFLGNNALTQELVDACDDFLTFMESDKVVTSEAHRAYMLGTAWHETAHTLRPIRELGGKNYFIKHYWLNVKVRNQLGNKSEYDAWARSGRGFVQVTGLGNDTKLTVALPKFYKELVEDFENKEGKKFDLVKNPEQALNPEIAYAIMSYGMATGLFTGKSMKNYISDNPTISQLEEARRVVNGTDKKAIIAKYAMAFYRILVDCKNVAEDTEPLISQEPVTTEPSSSATETTKSVSTEADGTTVAKEVVEKNEQDVNETAKVVEPEPYNGIGFWATIKRDLAAVFGGNLTLQGLSEYLKSTTDLPQWFIALIPKVILLVVVASVAYLLFRLAHFAIDTYKKNQRLKVEAEAKTNITKKDIEWVKPETEIAPKGFLSRFTG